MSATDVKVTGGVESPCIRICTLDDDDVCLGCYRDITEICAWTSAGDNERLTIVEAAEARRLVRQRRD